MALRNPDVGDIAPVAWRDAIVSKTRMAFPAPATAVVRAWKGPINASTIRKFSTQTPAVIITFEGIDEFEYEGGGGQIRMPFELAATFITRPREHGDEDDANAAMAVRFVRILAGNKWGLDYVDAPAGMKGVNAFDPKGAVGEAGVNIWVVKWCQNLLVNKLTDAELATLPDLHQIFLEYRQGNADAPGIDRSSDFP